MITLELFAKLYVPIGFIFSIGIQWYIVSIFFKEKLDNEDILLCCLSAFIFGFNFVFILWGVSLL